MYSRKKSITVGPFCDIMNEQEFKMIWEMKVLILVEKFSEKDFNYFI